MANQKKLAGGAILILCFSLFFNLALSWGQTGENLKTVLNQAKAYFFAPNLDFRGGGTSKVKTMEGAAAADKVKEAMAESMGKTKATVEDSAKIAAKLATETIQQTKEKVKRSFSPQHDQQEEL